MHKYEEAIEHYDESIAMCPNNENFCKEIAKKKEQVEDEQRSKSDKNIKCHQSIGDRMKEVPNVSDGRKLKFAGIVMNGSSNKDKKTTSDKYFKQFIHMDNSVPSFDLDSFPVGCDIPKCKRRLNEFHEYARYRNGRYMSFKQNKKPDEMDYFERIGNNCSHTVEWYSNSHPGDINTRPVLMECDSIELQSFSYEINRSEILTPGTTHVVIGFTDLGFFHTAKFNPELTPEKPLKWFGYEASAYCCAKTAIITTMMMMNAPSDHVLQVWYSATWSKETLKSFKSAIEMLLNSN